MATPAEQRSIELEIGGMTCASCAARIEKRLGKIEGVTATVNFATEKAKLVIHNPFRRNSWSSRCTPRDIPRTFPRRPQQKPTGPMKDPPRSIDFDNDC